MKTKAHPLQQRLTTAFFAMGLTFVSLPALQADDDAKIKIDDDEIKVEIDDGEAKIEADGEVEVDGENGARALQIARATLAEQEAKEFQGALAKGYVIPQDRYVYMDPVPETYVQRLPEPAPNVAYRSFNGNIYAVNTESYKVVDIIKTDTAGNTIEVRTTAPASDLTTLKQQMVKGYVIPEDSYVYLNQVPDRYVTLLPPRPQGTIYRYLDGTVYAVNPTSYQVVDVIDVSTTARSIR